VETSRIAALLAPFLAGDGLSPLQLAQVSSYLDVLLRWNARMNLTAVRQLEEIITRHFGESFFAAAHLYPPHQVPQPENPQLIDVGSGAGFPGLPIKLFAPSLALTLVESNHRKATFLREVVRALALGDVEILAARLEALLPRHPHQPPAISQKPSATHLTVTLRAVEHFETILPIAARLLTESVASGRLALLIGAAQAARARQLLPNFVWSDPAPIPQSASRILLIGSPAAVR